MKRTQGFSLIELLIAVSVFSIIMIALSGLVVQGLRLRRVNELENQAQAYAAAVLERFKTYWSVRENYNSYDADLGSATALEPLVGLPQAPAAFEAEGEPPILYINTGCVELNGTFTEDPCAETPPLRRVQIVLTGSDGKVYSDLITEVGNPSP